MKLAPVILVVASSLATTLSASAKKDVISKDTVLNAIATFRIEPTSETGRAAAAIVVEFVDQSHDVSVTLGDKTLSFMKNKSIPERYRAALISAFIVGDADSQLLRNKKGDDSYAGLIQMIDTYRYLQQTKPSFRVAEIDQFIEMEKHGQLKAYVSGR
jgi:hypothetical protein